MILAKKAEKQYKTDVFVLVVLVVLNATGHCSLGWPCYVAQMGLQSAVVFCPSLLSGGITACTATLG